MNANTPNHVNSPNKAAQLTPEDRAVLLDSIITHATTSPDFKFAAEFKRIELMTRADSPDKDDDELVIVSPIELADAINLSIKLRIPKLGEKPFLTIRIDSSMFDSAPFESQKGKFLFLLSHTQDGCGVYSVGNMQDSSNTTIPVLDTMQENRLIELLDFCLFKLNDQFQQSAYVAQLNDSFFHIFSDNIDIKTNPPNPNQLILHFLKEIGNKGIMKKENP